jgi:hypothetical protein
MINKFFLEAGSCALRLREIERECSEEPTAKSTGGISQKSRSDSDAARRFN